MKVLAVISTQGSINTLRPDTEQFIEMSKFVSIDIMTQQNSDYAKIIKDAGIPILGDFPEHKKDKEVTQQIRELLIKNNYDILYVLHRKAIACGLRAAKGLKTKVVVYRGASGMYWHDPSAYENALNPRVSKVICVCNDIRDNLHKQLFFKKGKAITVYKGHRMQWYQDVKKANLKELGVDEGDFTLACTANNRKWKGIPTLLDAIDLLPTDAKIKLLLVGNGMDSPYYKKKIDSNKNKDKIITLGFRNDVLEIAKATDVIMQTSYKNEGLSRSTIEGMSLGCVPIMTDAGGNAELVLHNECGLVVPIKDAQAMADAIMQLYTSPDLMQQYAKASHERIKNDFTTEKTAQETIKVFEDLLK